jgi:membrane-associated protease RseP (regulator of RpoE activity)
MMINLFVGLFNMLPLGILDGGRFFYLAILTITKKESLAKKSFKNATRLIGLIFLVMMIAWVFSLF